MLNNRSHLTRSRSAPPCRARDKTEKRCRRRGLVLLEAITASLVVGLVLGLTVPVLVWISAERRATQCHQEALAEANSILERLTAQPWDDITPARARELRLSESLQKQLSESQLEVHIESPAGDADAKRIRLHLSWKDRADHRIRPVRLSAWVYRQEARP